MLVELSVMIQLKNHNSIALDFNLFSCILELEKKRCECNLNQTHDITVLGQDRWVNQYLVYF